jgi:hypothetical protein
VDGYRSAGRKATTLELSLILIWRPRRDSNPCYRRERAVS